MACYSWAIAWSKTHVSLPQGVLAPDMTVTGLGLAPRAWCRQPTSLLLPGKEGSVITRLPSHIDVIPTGFLLAVGSLVHRSPQPEVMGSQGPSTCGREGVTVLAGPGPSS